MRWEIQVRIDAHGVVLRGGHHVRMPGVAQPALLAVEGRDALAVG